MRRSLYTVLAAALVVIISSGPAAAQASKCAAAKYKEAGKKAFGKAKCHSKAVKKGLGVDLLCLEKVEGKFSAKWAKAEAKGGCLTTGDETAIEAKVDVLIDDLVTALGGLGPSKCTAAKYKEAGKKAFGKAKCHSKAVKKGLAVDPACLQKAELKFTQKWAKAELRGDCLMPIGDENAIEMTVDEFIADLVAELAPAATTTTAPSTTTTAPSTTTTAPSTTTTSTTTTTTTGGCDCCAGGPTLLSFDATTASGTCGTLENFRCSNDVNGACGDDSDCDFGNCIDPPGICDGDFTVTCSGAGTPCTGTCGEVVAGGLPLSLDCGVWYQGGGGNSFPPSLLADMGALVAEVTNCSSNTLTLGAATSGQTGSVSTCTSMGCLFGPPLPVPNEFSTPTSHCNVLTVAQDAAGLADCNGNATLDLPLEVDIFLTGDALSSLVGPINVPGIQTCPLCTSQCDGGSNFLQPCEDDSDCPGSTCDGVPNCIGGPSDGAACTPGSSALSQAFPTSPDCPPDPFVEILSDHPFELSLTTGTSVKNGVDQPQAQRVFCGFCRDRLIEGSECFDGNPDPGMTSGCPDSLAQPTCQPFSGSTAGCGTAIPCDSDVDCTAPYESCAQNVVGAFSYPPATQLTLTGDTAGACLADELAHDATVVSAFCIPPSFDATIDAALSWPGPGAVSLEGTLTLSP